MVFTYVTSSRFILLNKRTYSHENWDEFPVSIKRNGRYFFHMVTPCACRLPRSLVYQMDKDVGIGRVKSKKWGSSKTVTTQCLFPVKSNRKYCFVRCYCPLSIAVLVANFAS